MPRPDPIISNRKHPQRRGAALVRRAAVVAALLSMVLLAGCTDRPDGKAPVDIVPLPQEAPVEATDDLEFSHQPDSSDLRKFADALANTWNPEARLVLISAFEGELEDPPGGAGPNRWTTPFIGQPGLMADGRSPVWAYSYAVMDEFHDLAMAVCSTGIHAEVREAYVVIVRADGTIASAYTSRSDEEAAAPTGFVPDEAISSSEAAEIARSRTDVADWAERGVWSRTFLVTDWFEPGPLWLFIVEDEEWRLTVLVDALTGEVVHEGGLPGAKC